MHFPISEMQVVSESKRRTRESKELFMQPTYSLLCKPSLELIKPTLLEGLGHKRWHRAHQMGSMWSCLSDVAAATQEERKLTCSSSLKGVREEWKIPVLLSGKQEITPIALVFSTKKTHRHLRRAYNSSISAPCFPVTCFLSFLLYQKSEAKQLSYKRGQTQTPCTWASRLEMQAAP